MTTQERETVQDLLYQGQCELKHSWVRVQPQEMTTASDHHRSQAKYKLGTLQIVCVRHNDRRLEQEANFTCIWMKQQANICPLSIPLNYNDTMVRKITVPHASDPTRYVIELEELPQEVKVQITIKDNGLDNLELLATVIDEIIKLTHTPVSVPFELDIRSTEMKGPTIIEPPDTMESDEHGIQDIQQTMVCGHDNGTQATLLYRDKSFEEVRVEYYALRVNLNNRPAVDDCTTIPVPQPLHTLESNLGQCIQAAFNTVALRKLRVQTLQATTCSSSLGAYAMSPSASKIEALQGTTCSSLSLGALQGAMCSSSKVKATDQAPSVEGVLQEVDLNLHGKDKCNQDTPAQNLLKTFQEELTCSICTGSFTDPKELDCRHTFCKTCLQEWLKAQRKKKIIPCPICRQMTRLGKEGLGVLKTNVIIHNLAERVKLVTKEVDL